MYYKLLSTFCLLALMLIGCSKNLSYEDKISRILVYEEGMGEYTDEQFEKVFNLIESNPETFDYDFSELNIIKVVTSDDNNIKAYVLDRCGFGGNPNHDFDTSILIQYRSNNEIHSYRIPEDYRIITEIAHLDSLNYLIISFSGIIARGEHYNSEASVYKFTDGDPKQVPEIFEIGVKKLDSIKISWNGTACSSDEMVFSKIADEFYYDEFMKTGIIYNPLDKTLYIPNMIETSDKYSVLDGTINRYKWNGSKFEDVTIIEPYEIRNDDYYIRIEQMSNGDCVYKCWNGYNKVGKPNLTIYNGKREIWDELNYYDYNKWVSFDAYQPLGEVYTFMNNGYTYKYFTGWKRGQDYENLEIYDPKERLIYSGRFEQVD